MSVEFCPVEICLATNAATTFTIFLILSEASDNTAFDQTSQANVTIINIWLDETLRSYLDENGLYSVEKWSTRKTKDSLW